MKVFRRCAVACTLLCSSALLTAQQAGSPPAAPPKPGMTLSSTSIEDGGIIPDKYTQKSTATPVSPELEWKNVPAGVVSYVLIMHDPDNAPQHSYLDTLHWMAFNIPGTATSLPENVPAGTATLPDGTVQVKNARGAVGYLGPGAGAQGPYHHYIFEVLALDMKLTLGPDAARADVMHALDGHVLAKGILFARFHR